VAIIIRGSSRCAVCDQVIQKSDQVIGLPHFVADESNPHWRYTDSGFHPSCWADLPERKTIEGRINALDKQHGYPPRFGEHS
jgi:hypothetical protein